MKFDEHVCDPSCGCSIRLKRRGREVAWDFPFCATQSRGVLDPAIRQLAIYFSFYRPAPPTPA